MKEIARRLGWSEERFERERVKSVQTHGTAGEVVLERWLKATWEEMADRCVQLGKTDDYEVTMMESLDGKTPVPFYGRTIGAWDGAPEPECVRPEYQTFLSMQARTRRAEEVERIKQQSQQQIRALSEALRERANKGEDLTIPLARVARELRMNGTIAA